MYIELSKCNLNETINSKWNTWREVQATSVNGNHPNKTESREKRLADK